MIEESIARLRALRAVVQAARNVADDVDQALALAEQYADDLPLRDHTVLLRVDMQRLRAALARLDAEPQP